jgi:hypothetical protein
MSCQGPDIKILHDWPLMFRLSAITEKSGFGELPMMGKTRFPIH